MLRKHEMFLCYGNINLLSLFILYNELCLLCLFLSANLHYNLYIILYFIFSLHYTCNPHLYANHTLTTILSRSCISYTNDYSLTTNSLSPNSYLLSREGFDVEFYPERFGSLLIVYSKFSAVKIPGNSHYTISEFKIIF